MRRRHPKRTITRDLRTRRPLHPGRERDELEAVAWPDRILVRDCMSRQPVTIQSDALARGAAQLMMSRKLRHLPVLDRGGRLVGIVTDRDLRQVVFDPALQARLGTRAEAVSAVTVGDVMTRGVITVRPGAEIREAARVMRQHKFGALPVVENDRVVGILTESDVLEAFQKVLGEGVLARPYRWALAYR